MRLAGHRPDRRRAAEVLAQVGLGDKGRRRPGQLSGGQQQRVAIARALITRPDVVFADEPTGALDTTTAAEILGLLRTAVDGLGATVVMVTHDPAAAAYADRVLFLADGRIVDQLRRRLRATIAARMTTLARPRLRGSGRLMVPNGLARAAVRFKPAAFAGTFVALMMAAMIVSACGILLETGVRAGVRPSSPKLSASPERGDPHLGAP